jgi:endogenous inhibitor of DNA gyrase (YacG/DUF329 family)
MLTITCPTCGHPLATRRREPVEPRARTWGDALTLTPGVSDGGMQVRDGRLHLKCPICATWTPAPDAPDGADRDDD